MLARLVSFRDLAPGTRHFVFEADAPLHYQAGQFVSFTQTVDGKEITRAYSLASAPSETSRFELCLNLVSGGKLTPFLFAMQPGSAIPMRPPLGTFTLRESGRPVLFVATGTGIAPFRAILQAHRRSIPETLLLFGCRHESGLLYRNEFETMAASPGFHFWPTITRPEPGWNGRTGRVQAHLEAAMAGGRALDIYLCGLKEMVDDVRRILKEMGFDRKQIFYEKYD